MNFQSVSGTLTWADGDASDRTITIPLLHKDTAFKQKMLQVMLQNQKGECELTVRMATITITGNEQGAQK